MFLLTITYDFYFRGSLFLISALDLTFGDQGLNSDLI